MNNKNFESYIFKESLLSNIPDMLFTLVIPVLLVRLQLIQMLWAALCVVSMVVVSELLISPLTNIIISRKLTNFVSKWTDKRIISSKERTLLIQELNRYPFMKFIETFCRFLVSGAITCLLFHFVPMISIDVYATTFAFCTVVYGSFNSSLKASYDAKKICNDYIVEIYKDGIDSSYVFKKKFFGFSTLKKCIMYIVIPITFTNILFLFIQLQTFKPINGSLPTPNEQIIRMAVISIACVLLCINLTILYFKQIKSSNIKMSNTIDSVFSKKKSERINDCNLSDEMQYNIFLLNTIVDRYINLIEKATDIGDHLLKNTGELSVLSQEFAATSVTQNRVIQEVKDNAEVQKSISLEIQEKVNSVSYGIEKTSFDVDKSLETLDHSISQMRSIENENSLNMQRIKSLSRQIDNIDDILIMIKDIADQTRIIAFNAELEAVSAKEEGRNFHIVATEIRRLANSTMNSIHEIQSNIENIQHASLSLIHSSENVTSYIQEENNITHELEEHFNSIRDSADITNTKSMEIREIIEQQTSAFEAITVTLAQISEGFKQFTISTKSISETSEKMKENASVLSSLNDEMTASV